MVVVKLACVSVVLVMVALDPAGASSIVHVDSRASPFGSDAVTLIMSAVPVIPIKSSPTVRIGASLSGVGSSSEQALKISTIDINKHKEIELSNVFICLLFSIKWI